jgi:hypothetical protein
MRVATTKMTCAYPNWKPIDSAPEGIPVRTIIRDEHGERNETTLTRQKGLWFFPDMSMYVYYRPTHWHAINEAPLGE